MLRPGLLPVAVALTAFAVVAGIGVAGISPREIRDVPGEHSWSAPGSRPDRTTLPEARALEVLHRWDVRRARAWARADPAGLRRLYVPGSRTGRRDVAMLERWRSRGLRVRRLQVQVLAARVLSMSHDRLVVVVTERVVGATAVGRGGVDTRLPRDRASTRVVRLRSMRGEWRVGEVRDQASPERRIARTPRSRKS